MTRAAIIVVGGSARRLNGVAKPWLSIGGLPIIDRIIDTVRPHVQQCVLVGEAPDWWSRDDIEWTREEPAGTGPAAAVRAGVARLEPGVDEVLLLAGDAPMIADPVAALLATDLSFDGVAVESDGRLQFLCARLRRQPLERALATGGSSMHSVYEHLQVLNIPAVLTDCDTWEDVARLRQEIPMNDWLNDVAAKLGIDPTIDIDAVLDLARDVAHNSERKNAPLTSYLLGYAAAKQNLDAAQIAAAAAEIGAMAKDRA